ncbi:MAG: hypothetical protein ACRYG4_02665 [Janthinobacterium lividum]
MIKQLLLAAVAVATIGTAVAADAQPYHRGHHQMRPHHNRGRYFNHGRYYHNRYRHNGAWMYR